MNDKNVLYSREEKARPLVYRLDEDGISQTREVPSSDDINVHCPNCNVLLNTVIRNTTVSATEYGHVLFNAHTGEVIQPYEHDDIEYHDMMEEWFVCPECDEKIEGETANILRDLVSL